MGLTEEILRQSLKTLKVAEWDWAGEKLPGKKEPEKAVGLDVLTKYCWQAYRSSRESTGDMVIGRTPHLMAAGLFEKVADIVGNKTLFDTGSRGNLLNMDKWARVMNDSWILGGVHRTAKFRLASPRILENVWNQAENHMVVTAREILGLLHFGYALQQVGPYQILVPQDTDRARAANLIEYDFMMQTSGSLRHAMELLDNRSPESKLMELMGSSRR